MFGFFSCFFQYCTREFIPLRSFLYQRCSNRVYVWPCMGGVSLIGSFAFHSQQFFTQRKLLFCHPKCNFYKILGLITALQKCCKTYSSISSAQTLYFSKACWIEREKKPKSYDYSRKSGILSESLSQPKLGHPPICLVPNLEVKPPGHNPL